MVMVRTAWLAAVLLSAAVGGAMLGGLGDAAAATITTTDGTIVTGDVQGVADGVYTIKTPYGVIKVPASSVAKVDPGPSTPSSPSSNTTPAQQTIPAAPSNSAPITPANTMTPPVPPPDSGGGTIRFAGSTTIGDELMPALVSRYAASLGLTQTHWVADQNNPDEQSFKATNASGSVLSLHLSRHGSATAFAALAAGTADVGMSSRHIRLDEAETLAAAGFGPAQSAEQQHVLAVDGVVVLVNRANPITTLSVTQIASIFAGDITDWKDVGGTPGPIHIYSRDSQSGTGDTFRDLVMRDRAVSSNAQLIDSSDVMADKVASDPAAIGYAGFAYIRRAKALRILTDCGLGVPPNEFLIRTEEYPLSRRLYLYDRANPDEKVKRFLDYALSDPGQNEVGKAGFVDLIPRLSVAEYGPNRITTALSQVGNDRSASSEMRAVEFFNKIAASGRLVSTTFHFRPDSFDPDIRAIADIKRLATALRGLDLSQLQLFVLGFSDADGSVSRDVRASVQRANKVAEMLRDEGIAPKGVFGLGRAAPIACNTTPDGRERNRRVEIWLMRSQS